MYFNCGSVLSSYISLKSVPGLSVHDLMHWLEAPVPVLVLKTLISAKKGKICFDAYVSNL